MRIYQDLYECAKETQRNLHELGVTIGLKSMQNVKGEFITKELEDESFTIINPLGRLNEAYELVYGSERAEIMKKWYPAEFEERTRPFHVNPGEAWKIRENEWSKFFSKEDSATFDYSYNERIRISLSYVIRELQRDINTRRAYLSIWVPELDSDLLEGNHRVPCSLGYGFKYRDGKLNVHYVMRSSDFYTHWLNDIVLAHKMNEFVADKLGIPTGKLSATFFSLHAYKDALDDRKIF